MLSVSIYSAVFCCTISARCIMNGVSETNCAWSFIVHIPSPLPRKISNNKYYGRFAFIQEKYTGVLNKFLK